MDFIFKQHMCLQTTTTATSLPSGTAMWNWRDVLNSADLHARTSQSTESTLGARTGGLGLSSTGGSKLDVQSVDAKSAALLSDVLRGQHGSVGARFITISLHLHAAGNAGNGFTRFGKRLVDQSWTNEENNIPAR